MELRRRNLELIASTNRQPSDSMQTAFFLGIDNSWNERQPGIPFPRLTNVENNNNNNISPALSELTVNNHLPNDPTTIGIFLHLVRF